jgi:hypothetical protein
MSDETHETHDDDASVDSGRPSLPGSGDPMKALLRRSLGSGGETDVRQGQILRGVQRKIRQRSKGRFFADGWATGTRGSYLLIALVMLVILVVAFVGLGPMSIR